MYSIRHLDIQHTNTLTSETGADLYQHLFLALTRRELAQLRDSGLRRAIYGTPGGNGFLGPVLRTLSTELAEI